MAMANRPELKIDDNNLKNQDIAIAYARNNLMPTLAAFGLYASSGLQGKYGDQHCRRRRVAGPELGAGSTRKQQSE